MLDCSLGLKNGPISEDRPSDATKRAGAAFEFLCFRVENLEERDASPYGHRPPGANRLAKCLKSPTVRLDEHVTLVGNRKLPRLFSRHKVPVVWREIPSSVPQMGRDAALNVTGLLCPAFPLVGGRCYAAVAAGDLFSSCFFVANQPSSVEPMEDESLFNLRY